MVPDFGVEINQSAVRIDALEQVLHPETLAADVLDSSSVLPVNGLHDEPHEHRALAAQFVKVHLLRIVRTVRTFTVVDEVRHLHVEQQRLVGIAHVESVEAAIFGDDAHVRLPLKALDGGFYADDILRSVRLTGNEVGRAEVYVAHFCGEEDVHCLSVGHFQPMGRYHPLEGQLPRQPVIRCSGGNAHRFYLFDTLLLCIRTCYAHEEGEDK